MYWAMPFSSFPLYQHTLEGKVTAVDTQLPVHRNAFHKEKNETSNIHTSKVCDPRLYSKEEIKQNKKSTHMVWMCQKFFAKSPFTIGKISPKQPLVHAASVICTESCIKLD